MSKQIPLTQGKVVIVDDVDYKSANRFKWSLCKSDKRYYAKCIVHLGYLQNPRRRIRGRMYLHQFLMRPPVGLEIDHKDHNGLNCQRENMRICTRTQNNGNQRSQKSCSSKYKGICFDATRSKWMAYIKYKGKRIHLGRFIIEKQAARAYDEAAKKYFGEFACTNF